MMARLGEGREFTAPSLSERNWHNLQVTDLKVSMSRTHPTVAAVDYAVLHPLDTENTNALEDVLRASPSPLDQVQRQAIHKRLGDGGGKEVECAMLVLHDGRWRIVSISVPK